MIKKAGLEQSSLVDPKTGLKIRVSTTARIRYREYLKDNFPEKESLSNIVLNDVIASDFYKSSNNVLHYFIAKSSNISGQNREWIEVRKLSDSRGKMQIFLSVLREGYIDIITIPEIWKKPKKARSTAG